MSRPSVTNSRDLVTCMFGMAVLLSLLTCRPVHAGGVRRVVQQQVVASPYYYQVAPQLQQQGMQMGGDMYQELLELRAYKEGVKDATGARVAEQPMPQTEPPAAPAEPTPAVDPEFAARYQTIAAKCVRCHTGENPKGKTWLDGTVPLDGPDAAAKRDAIVRMTYRGVMPKGQPLEDSEFGQVLAELYPEPIPEPEPEEVPHAP